MDKLKTTALGGLPLTADDIRWMLGRLTDPTQGIHVAFNNILRGYGDNFIIQGCVLGGVSGAFTLTEGWIMLGGELIKVDAQAPFDEAVNNTFVRSTTFDTRGNKTFRNASTNDVYEKNRANISGSVGTLAYNGNTFFQLSNQADFRDDSPAEAGIVILKKKVIEIGDWDMDTDGTIDVAHALGSSIFLKTRTITAMILDDNSNTLRSLDSDLVTFGSAVSFIDNTKVQLTRVAAGQFDNALYDSTSFNRGWITLEYEV